MNVSQDLSILHLIINASAVVQIVMLLLSGVSFMSWYYIFRKWFTIRKARTQTEQFERDFWSGGDLNNLYQSAVNNRHGTGSMERVIDTLDGQLRRHPYLIGEQFQSCDLVLAGLLMFAIKSNALTPTNAMQAYLARISARSAFQKMNDISAAQLAQLNA